MTKPRGQPQNSGDQSSGNHRSSHHDSSQHDLGRQDDGDSCQAWIEDVSEWLRTGRGMGSAKDREDQVTPLRPPAEVVWAVELFGPLSRWLHSMPSPASPSPIHATSAPDSHASSDPGSAGDGSFFRSVDGRNSDEVGEQHETMIRLQILLKHYAQWLMRILHDAAIEQMPQVDQLLADQVRRLYPEVHRMKWSSVEGPLLQCMAWNRHGQAVRWLADLLTERPPIDWSSTAIAISPFMRHRDWEVEWLFPKLLEALESPSTVAPVLDLANHVYRTGMAAEHPMEAKRELLRSLLGGVVSRLGVLEENPSQFGDSVAQIQYVLSESVALCVSICDALALMGDIEAIGKLNQALELRHRRVQTEAAAALARLDQERGREALIGLASEPSARLRVLAYAEELGIEGKIDERWVTALARAESELAIWLNQPQQMGLPPTSMELLDQRTLFWPGYNEPQECFLFRYAYTFGSGELSNVGIAGPMVHSFASDLADLPEDDIYAAFAGWCAEHEDIYEVESTYFNSAQAKEAQRLTAHLEQEGHEILRVLFMGFFVGERAVAVKTLLNDTEGIAVTDGLEVLWLATQGRIRPLGASEVYSIYKGRKILRSFNP